MKVAQASSRFMKSVELRDQNLRNLLLFKNIRPMTNRLIRFTHSDVSIPGMTPEWLSYSSFI
jgi:hypothetical protein